jgi:hypothetical protein
MATSRSEVLNEAAYIVTGERAQMYGNPEQNFDRIATMWGAYKGVYFEAHDVAAMLALLKVARIAVSPDRLDHWVDLAGYAACGGEVRPEVPHERT